MGESQTSPLVVHAHLVHVELRSPTNRMFATRTASGSRVASLKRSQGGVFAIAGRYTILLVLPASVGVTVIVAARNEQNVIRVTLENIASLRYPKELLQVLSRRMGPRTKTTRFASRSQAVIRPSLSSRPTGGSGKAAALNRAVERTLSDFLVILDADGEFRKRPPLRLGRGGSLRRRLP